MMRSRSLVAIGWATVVWVSLWGTISVANLLAGAAIGAVTVALVPVAEDRAHAGDGRVAFRPFGAMGFLGYFVQLLVVASAVVAWEVVTPRNRIHQGIVRLPLRTRSPGVATVIANAISLTPGTVTIEVADDPLTLYVHVLHLREVEDVRVDLRELEERALRAFDPAALDRPVPRVPTDTDEEPTT